MQGTLKTRFFPEPKIAKIPSFPGNNILSLKFYLKALKNIFIWKFKNLDEKLKNFSNKNQIFKGFLKRKICPGNSLFKFHGFIFQAWGIPDRFDKHFKPILLNPFFSNKKFLY